MPVPQDDERLQLGLAQSSSLDSLEHAEWLPDACIGILRAAQPIIRGFVDEHCLTFVTDAVPAGAGSADEAGRLETFRAYRACVDGIISTLVADLAGAVPSTDLLRDFAMLLTRAQRAQQPALLGQLLAVADFRAFCAMMAERNAALHRAGRAQCAPAEAALEEVTLAAAFETLETPSAAALEREELDLRWTEERAGGLPRSELAEALADARRAGRRRATM